MKKLGTLSVLLVLMSLAMSGGQALAAGPGGCATIQSGTITDSAGNPLALGFDQYGYNYQAHLFVGTYDSVDRNVDGTFWGSTGDYVDDEIVMKWSDAWLANVDCDGNGKLDRGLGTAGYDGDPATVDTSRGWETNHINGDYDSDGNGTEDAHYTYFAKIVWVGPGGSLWGEYQIIQEVYNDPVGGFTGLYSKEGAPGFGLNDHWTD